MGPSIPVRSYRQPTVTRSNIPAVRKFPVRNDTHLLMQCRGRTNVTGNGAQLVTRSKFRRRAAHTDIMQIYEQVFDEPLFWRHSAQQDLRVTLRSDDNSLLDLPRF